jgi:DNA-binding NarL/FixJ family response regulator
VFRNSYTRRGRLIRLRTWSVKIQHLGRRRTLSLGAVSRSEAARKAYALHRVIVAQGWNAILDASLGRHGSQEGPAAETRAGTRPRFWRRRLLTRPHTGDRRGPATRDLSIRIEHAGEGHYFPLGTSDTREASHRAAAIYRTVLADGWGAAKRSFPREITAAVFWAVDPLACTYSTLLTDPTGDGRELDGGAVRRASGLVGIVEADAGVRRAVTTCIASQEGVASITTLGTGGEALRLGLHLEVALLFVNRSLPDMAGWECAERMRVQRPDLPVFTYGIYSDSNQLFLSFGGVDAGYIFRRRPPALLAEPICPLAPRAIPADQVTDRIRHYFQSLFDAPSVHDTLVGTRLTPREQEVLEYLSKGYMDREIAQRIGISAWTVHGHLRSIFGKLQVHTRTEAAVRYLQK